MKVIEKVIPESKKIYKPSEPFMAKMLENKRLLPAGSLEDIRHIVLDLTDSGISYLEGQSIGVIAPGKQENGKNQRPRLYTISSARKGDDGLASTVSLTVKRVVYQTENNETAQGVASSFLCDAKPGDTITVTGPNGRKFLLPEDDKTDLIMIAAGTGIAPFRAFVHHIYRERGAWNGRVRLFYGTRTGMESLYMNDESNDIGQFFTKETFAAFQALSREQKTATGEKVYVQHRLEENQQEIWEMIKQGNFCLYICGLKGLEAGVEARIKEWAGKENADWENMRARFMEEGRWNIEVY